jgi:hypothetical protein
MGWLMHHALLSAACGSLNVCLSVCLYICPSISISLSLQCETWTRLSACPSSPAWSWLQQSDSAASNQIRASLPRCLAALVLALSPACRITPSCNVSTLAVLAILACRAMHPSSASRHGDGGCLFHPTRPGTQWGAALPGMGSQARIRYAARTSRLSYARLMPALSTPRYPPFNHSQACACHP